MRKVLTIGEVLVEIMATTKGNGFHEAHDAALDRKLASYDDAARYMVRVLEPDPIGLDQPDR